MSFTTVVKPAPCRALAQGRGSGATRPSSTCSTRQARARIPTARCSSTAQDRITYGAAQGQGRALRRLPAPHRHQARRRRHHPAAEPHRLSDRLLLARADRRHRQQGQPRLPRARARLHPALLGQPRLRLPRLLQGLRLRRHGAAAARRHSRARRTWSCPARRVDGEWNLEQGIAETPAARRRRPRAHERRRDLPHGLHVGHDRQSQVRAALVQHDAAGRAPDQRRHGRDGAGRAARLPAGLSQLGLPLPAAGDRLRQPAPYCSSASRRRPRSS